MIPQDDPALTAYLNELLRTSKPEHQDNKFWFPTPKNPGKPEDHTPMQTRIINELNELKDKEKLNPQESTESRNKFLKRFDWTDTLLTETEKQAIQDILIDYHNIFARHRMDIGMNREIKVQLTPKDDKAVYNQSLPLPIHLKEDLIVELALMNKYEIIRVRPRSKYASPIFAQRKPNGKLRLLVDLRKVNSLIADEFDSVNKALSDACELELKQPIPGKQLVLMTDASLRGAGYALVIEDNPDQKMQSKRKTYAPVAFGSEIFSPAQLKMSIYSKELLAIYMAFLEFALILWEATKPTIVLTDNKSDTRFFQTKAIPPALWNACDYVLQFNFKIAHIAGSVDTAADFLSRFELNVTEKIRLKIREDIHTTPIEVTNSSSDVADEEQIFFTHADDSNMSEEQTFERKEQSTQNSKKWAANE